MKKYFRGNIINVNKLPDYNYYINIIKVIPEYKESYYILDNTSHKALLYFRKYSGTNLKKLSELLKRIISFNEEKDEKEKLDKEMVNIFSPLPDNIDGQQIIYEKLYDENGNIYGKELITGAIFPINLKYSSFDVNYSLVSMERVYYEKDVEKGYYLKEASVKRIDKDPYYLLDFSGNQYGINYSKYNDLKYMWDSFITNVYFNDKCHELLVCNEPLSFNICLIPKMTFSSNQRIDYAINTIQIANELEIKEYLSRFDTGFGKKKRKREFENKINNYAFSNYLGEIHFVSNSIIKERVNESVITKEMQELEFLLFKLKSVSNDDYDILNKEYLELLNQNGLLHVNTLSLNSIISLQNKVNLAFICHGGNSKRIISYLEEQVNAYLESYNDGMIEKTKITIKDLDRISSYFLSSKNSYTIKEQNEILRCLSLLYFFEIYENKTILNSNDLKNSYIADNIKRILVIIGILQDEGIIKHVPSNLYNIDDLDEFLDFINKIEFSDFIEEKGNVLIKKMQQ